MTALRDARDLVVDAWSALSHKAPMRDDAEARIRGWLPQSWIGERHRRRLTAYTVLDAYEQNTSRLFLAGADSDRDNNREYGDAGLVVDQVLAHLLGEEQEIVVDGADAYDPALDVEPAEGETDERDPEEVAANVEAGQLADRQEFLRDWADTEHLTLRVVDCERNAVRDGDGVYLVTWSEDKQRPTVAVMHPGFYFPVLPDTTDAYEFPRRVHFAWELPGEDFPDGRTRLRRLTYELVRLLPGVDLDAFQAATTDEGRQAAAEILPEGARWERDRVTGVERLVRTYPWSADEPSPWTCTLTDATWVLDDIKDANDVDVFSVENASFAVTDDGELVRDLDLGIDFLPVVHVPNTPPGGDHFGQSSLARVLQLLDDLQSADTDAQAASATTGSPILVLHGKRTGASGGDPLTGQVGARREVKPGAVWDVGEDGGMDSLDTSGNLRESREYVGSLRDRLAVNARLPAAVLGTVKASEVPSGFAMLLSFGPLTSMIRQLRLVRSVKYPLLLKMVQRLYQANDLLPPGPTPRAELALGAFLPQDQQATLTMVREAYGAKLISLETAVGMLLEAGFAIDDVGEEIARIESRDFEGANRLVDATGNAADAREYLGRESVDPEQVTPAPLPGQPGEGGDPIAGGSGVGVPSPSDSGGAT